MPFDIHTAKDQVVINIMNMAAPPNERILVPKVFVVGPENIDEEAEDDDISQLKMQRPVNDKITIQMDDGQIVGEIDYQATWIYNKTAFLEELRDTMINEKNELIKEIKNNDLKLKLISEPFGGFRNVLEVDDIHFEDPLLPQEYKNRLKVSAKEEALNQQFNAVTNTLGMRQTQWGRLTIFMFAMWSVLTSITCFQKADFLNQTLAVLGLSIFLDPQKIKQSYLRLMVVATGLTYVYDIFWIVHKHKEYAEDRTEGGMAQVVLMLVWFLLFFKLILVIVMWKASLNFQKFVRQ